MTTIKRGLNTLEAYKVLGAFNLFNENGQHNAPLIRELVEEKITENHSLDGTGDTTVVVLFEGEELTVSCRYSFYNLDNLGEKINKLQEELLNMTPFNYTLDFDVNLASAIYFDTENNAYTMSNLLNAIPEDLKEEANDILSAIDTLENLII